MSSSGVKGPIAFRPDIEIPNHKPVPIFHNTSHFQYWYLFRTINHSQSPQPYGAVRFHCGSSSKSGPPAYPDVALQSAGPALFLTWPSQRIAYNLQKSPYHGRHRHARCRTLDPNTIQSFRHRQKLQVRRPCGCERRWEEEI